MVSILDEYSTGFLRDLGGLISGAFSFLEFILGLSFFCGQKLTEWTITVGTTSLDFFLQTVGVIQAIGGELWDFGGSVVRGVLLIYYGICLIFEAFYLTAVDLKSFSVHVFTSVGSLLSDTKAAIAYHAASAFVHVPKHICDSLALLGNTVMEILQNLLLLLADFVVQLVVAPINVIRVVGALLYKVALIPVQAFPHVPLSAHVGLAVIIVVCTVYWKFSIWSLLRAIPGMVRYVCLSIYNLFVIACNLKHITEETIRSGVQPRSGSPRRETTARCVVCKEATVSIISMPCKHVCLCYSCVKVLVDFDSRCPLCRRVVTTYEKVYIPS